LLLGGLAVVLVALGIGLLATGGRHPGVLVDSSRTAAAAGASPAEPRVEGQRLVLDPVSPQLASLTTAPAVAAAPGTIRLGGRLVWNEDVTVRIFSPFSGRVVDVRVDAGQRVASGDVLATIAAPDFGQAQADARRAAANLALADRTLERLRDLLQHGVVAQKDVEAAEADAARARAEQQRAQARLALYGGDSTSVTQIFPLRTPIVGVVVERAINPGQEVRPDQMLANAPQLFAPLFVVTDPSRLWIQVDLPERDVPDLAAGAPLGVRTEAWPDRVFRGRVTLVGSAVDPTTRTVKVRGTVVNPGGLLKAEMLATVDAPLARTGALAVPTAAVLLDGDTHVVFVEESRGRYRRCPVQVGGEHGGLVPVLAGLQSGERVVTGGSLLLERMFQLVQGS